MTTNRSRPSDNEISRQTFLRGTVSVLATASVFPTTRAAADPATDSDGLTSSTTTEMSIIPYSTPDIPNPGRGMYDWNGVIDFPIGSAATWPIEPQYYHRPLWSDIDVGTTGPSYNWASLDNLMATAASNGQRFGLRIMPINPWSANGMPRWLWGTSAVTAYNYGGSTWYVPNYNDATYLGAACNFITALGVRYDKDERFAWFEFSLYGDWSEGDCYQTCTDLGIPAPMGTAALSQLGYWVENGVYQLITAANVQTLVNAHVNAFPNTQLVSTNASNNFAIHKGLLTANTLKPAGTRYDGLANVINSWSTPAPIWCLDPGSYYLTSNNGGPDPFLVVAMTQWQRGPVITESGPVQLDFSAAIPIVCNYPVSLVSSLSPAGSTDSYGLAIKYSGYRYAVSSITAPSSVAPGNPVLLTATWNNYGVAPTYDRWQITYQLRNSSGTVVSSVNSSLDLKTLFNPAQGNTVVGQGPQTPLSSPLGASATDTVTLATTALTGGSYTIAVVVTWHEHKAGATYTWNYPPMKLAQTPGPSPDGSYPLVNVTLT